MIITITITITITIIIIIINEVDMWSLGVIVFILLTGKPPYSVDQLRQRNYRLYPNENWSFLSSEAKEFCSSLLTVDQAKRATADLALKHPWLSEISVANTTLPTASILDEITCNEASPSSSLISRSSLDIDNL
jgi:serine/threonine protein kinase